MRDALFDTEGVRGRSRIPAAKLGAGQEEAGEGEDNGPDAAATGFRDVGLFGLGWTQTCVST